VLLLKFLTNCFKSIKSGFKTDSDISFTNSTVFLTFTELFMLVLGILLALYINRWNSTQKFENNLRQA
jgi:hypothetical protein